MFVPFIYNTKLAIILKVKHFSQILELELFIISHYYKGAISYNRCVKKKDFQGQFKIIKGQKNLLK